MVWKFRLKNILHVRQLWDVVDPDQEVNNRGISSNGVSNEERKREVRAIIQLTVAFPIRGNYDPRECWTYLQNKFAPNTSECRFEFMRRLFTLRMEEGEKVMVFAHRVEDMLNHLHDMGEIPKEKEVVQCIMKALPKSWYTVASIFWQEIDMLTKDKLLYRRMKLLEPRIAEQRAETRGC